MFTLRVPCLDFIDKFLFAHYEFISCLSIDSPELEF